MVDNDEFFTSCCLCSSLVAWSAEEKRRNARSERGEPRSDSFQSVSNTCGIVVIGIGIIVMVDIIVTVLMVKMVKKDLTTPGLPII